MKNILIGIGIGILIILGLYLYHTNSVKKAYQSGLKDCISDSLYIQGDTLTVHDTIYTVIQTIVPHTVYKDTTLKLVIDTTIYFQEAGKVHVFSDDIVKGLEIEPIYYLEHNYVYDTVFVNKIKYIELPEKPLAFYEKPTFLITTGAIIGGVIVYYLRK